MDPVGDGGVGTGVEAAHIDDDPVTVREVGRQIGECDTRGIDGGRVIVEARIQWRIGVGAVKGRLAVGLTH